MNYTTKQLKVIDDYAHDYREIKLDQEHFGAMLKEFLEAYLDKQAEEKPHKYEPCSTDSCPKVSHDGKCGCPCHKSPKKIAEPGYGGAVHYCDPSECTDDGCLYPHMKPVECEHRWIDLSLDDLAQCSRCSKIDNKTSIAIMAGALPPPKPLDEQAQEKPAQWKYDLEAILAMPKLYDGGTARVEWVDSVIAHVESLLVATLDEQAQEKCCGGCEYKWTSEYPRPLHTCGKCDAHEPPCEGKSVEVNHPERSACCDECRVDRPTQTYRRCAKYGSCPCHKPSKEEPVVCEHEYGPAISALPHCKKCGSQYQMPKPPKEGKWDKDLAYLNAPYILMPKMYSFTDVRGIIALATKQARVEVLNWVLASWSDKNPIHKQIVARLAALNNQ